MLNDCVASLWWILLTSWMNALPSCIWWLTEVLHKVLRIYDYIIRKKPAQAHLLELEFRTDFVVQRVRLRPGLCRRNLAVSSRTNDKNNCNSLVPGADLFTLQLTPLVACSRFKQQENRYDDELVNHFFLIGLSKPSLLTNF